MHTLCGYILIVYQRLTIVNDPWRHIVIALRFCYDVRVKNPRSGGKMLEKLYPDYEFAKATDVSLDFMRRKGIRGLIVDIDNTIVKDRSDCPEEDVAEWLGTVLSSGIGVCILSNGSRRRVEYLCGLLKTDGIHKAGKPSLRGFRRAMDGLGLDNAREAAVIGDQLFTDIYGANKAGMVSILVRPLSIHENEFVRFKRLFEKPILRMYHRNRIKRGDDDGRTS
jgi:HAD superfamily phosphatase (TIGR01668 family)